MNIKMPSRAFQTGFFAVVMIGMAVAIIALLVWVISDSRKLPDGPQLTNQRMVYVQDRGIWFGCDGTVGVYRSAYDNQVSAVLGHPACA